MTVQESLPGQADNNQDADSDESFPTGFDRFMDYLESEQGHAIASSVISLFEEIKKATLDKSNEQWKVKMDSEHKTRTKLMVLQGVVFVVSIGAVTLLTFCGKFDSTSGLFFGTLVGYFFGRKPNSTP